MVIEVLVIFVVISLAFVLLFWLMDRTSPVIVGPDGMQCYDGFGARRSFRWEDVRKVAFVNLGLGLKILIIDQGASVAFRPCFASNLRDFDALASHIVQHAGPENPLSHVLVRRWRIAPHAGG